MANYTIYEGRWTDYSKGSLNGDQITLNPTRTNYLVAGLAVVHTLAGGLAWNIIAFVLYHYRANPRPQHGMYHQIQTLLKNAGTPMSFATSTIFLGFRWRNHPELRPILRSAALCFTALFVSIGFAGTGIFLPLVSSTGLVLMHSEATWNTDFTNRSQKDLDIYNNALQAELTSNWNLDISFAQTCYNANGAAAATAQTIPASNCDYFVQPKINWTTTFHNECPFLGDVCSVPPEQIIKFDTGLLDSNTDFGINAPTSERALLRRNTTCSPLKTNGFIDTNFTDLDGTTGSIAYFYGSAIGGRSLNATYVAWRATNTSFIANPELLSHPTSPYEIYGMKQDEVAVVTEDGVVVQDWESADIFNLPNGVVSLFIMTNAVVYTYPVQDPWFNATEPVTWGDVRGYQSSLPQPLACMDEFQVCNPSNNQCTDLPRDLLAKYNTLETDSTFLDSAFHNLSMNSKQSLTAFNILGSLYMSTAYFGTRSIGASAIMEASQMLEHSPTNRFISPDLPVDQWQREMQRFQALSLSYVQRDVVYNNGGPLSPVIRSFTVPYPADSDTLEISMRQKIRQTSYTSFSVLALGCIFGVDGCILLLWLFILWPLPQILRKTGALKYQQRAYAADGLLQLHRGLYHRVGRGEWVGSLNEDPVTLKPERFEALVESYSDVVVDSAHGAPSVTKESDFSESCSCGKGSGVTAEVESMRANTGSTRG